MGSWRSATKFLRKSLGDEGILTNRSSELYMGKHSRAIDSIVVHVFVGFVIQHIIISVNAFLITQLL
jgi:hypothetical protein